MDSIDYLKIARRRWKLVVAAFLVAVTAAWVTTPARPGPPISTFRASHTLLQTDDEPGRLNLETTALFVTTGEVPARVAKKIGFTGDPAILASQVTVDADPKVGTLVIRTTNSDGERAALVANAFAEEIVTYLRDEAQAEQAASNRATIAQLDALTKKISALDSLVAREPEDRDVLVVAQRDAQVNQYRVVYERFQQLAREGAPTSGFATLQRATPIPVLQGGFAPPSSRKGRVVGAGILGLLLGTGLVLLLERLDTRLRTRPAVERAFRLPVVAEVPRASRKNRRGHVVMTIAHPESVIAESYRTLRSSLLLMPSRPVGWFSTEGAGERARPTFAGNSAVEDPRVILVTSPSAGEGKTTTVANLAACMAEAGRSVLVLGADFRRPELHRYLGVAEGVGLSNLLAQDRGIELRSVARKTSINGVELVQSGSATDHPGALLTRIGEVIAVARTLADVVLIDTAPILATNDVTDILPHVDSVLMLSRAGRTTAEQASRAAELLSRVGAAALGITIVGSSPRPQHNEYYDSRVHRAFLRRLSLRRRGELELPAAPPIPPAPVRVPASPAPVRVSASPAAVRPPASPAAVPPASPAAVGPPAPPASMVTPAIVQQAASQIAPDQSGGAQVIGVSPARQADAVAAFHQALVTTRPVLEGDPGQADPGVGQARPGEPSDRS